MTLATTKTVGEIAAEMPAQLANSKSLESITAAAEAALWPGVRGSQHPGGPGSCAAGSKRSRRATAIPIKDWQKQLLADLIVHITTTHHVFVREESPRIEALAAKVVSVHGKNHPELLQVQQIFSVLAEELRVHLMKEEQMLFPYISLMEGSSLAGEPAPPAVFGTVANPVRMMMQEHDGAGDALRSLRPVTSDYTVPEDACISYRTLYEALDGYEADLHQHIHLENNILFPRAVAMEGKR